MAKVNLIDFFKYFKGTPNQIKAIEMLAEVLPESLSRDRSPWIVQFREPEPEPEAPAWPITKAQMAAIMLCSESSLPDSLMDDYARCVANADGHSHAGVPWEDRT